MKIVNLEPPLLSSDHIDEYITCVRPHRERLFNVSIERMGNQYIYHNYGQGGAGWTFLFGCVAESIRLFKENHSSTTQPITIIGAGCYGLLTAIELQRLGYQVTIVARETDNVTSDKAAGFFFPRNRKSSTAAEIAVFSTLGIASYKTYLTIASGTHPYISAGAKVLPAYYGIEIDPGFSTYIQNELMPHPTLVTIDFNNGMRYGMIEYHTIFMDSTVLMSQLRTEINKLNILIIHAEIQNFSDLSSEIIFNCSGFGAKKLTLDAKIIPVQGHLISLKNQSTPNYMINAQVIQINPQGKPRNELIYLAPKGSGILGITFLRNQDGTYENTHEFERLLARSRNFFTGKCA